MKAIESLGSGLAGACALTALHETARQVLEDAPRMDVLGMRAISEPMRKMGMERPANATLHRAALGGDILSNGLYYSLVGLGGKRGAWLRGVALGLAAGIGGVVLPGPLGLGRRSSARTPATALMTVGWYLVGGLAAAAAFHMLAGPTERDEQQG